MKSADDSAASPGLAVGWRRLTRHMSSGIDRGAVIEEIRDGGELTGRYLLMSALSSAIATLGLLMSSPAVVIGAMLLSPLMGPIISLGFSFWMVDWRSTRRAMTCLATGLAVGLAVAILVTWLSPLKEATSEILSRAHPTLLDLMVAVLSGVAGGYAVVRQRGETAIAVAIATALMPPIATAGYGIGVGSTTIALGALLLFATNLIAIALAAAGVAALYGFRQHGPSADRGWIGHVSVVAVLGLLCIPLTLSLHTIALEGRASASTRAIVREMFGPKARLTSLDVRSEHGVITIDGLVATPKYLPDGPQRLARREQDELGAKVHVSLDQIVLADPSRLQAASDTAKREAVTRQAEALRAAVPFAATVAIDSASHRGVVVLNAGSGLTLASARQLEMGLRDRDDLPPAEVIPPIAPLDRLSVEAAADGGLQFEPALTSQSWALKRWRAAAVSGLACGSASRKDELEPLAAKLKAALAPVTVDLSAGSRAECRGRGNSVGLTVVPAAQ